MQSLKFLLLSLGLNVVHVGAQTILNPAGCLPDSGVSTFPACDLLYNVFDSCSNLQVSASVPVVSCYCNQKVFNAFFDCESEQRRCFGNYNNDNLFQTAIYRWHTACDNAITFSPTTPLVTTLTRTFDADSCITARSACSRGDVLASQCSLSYTDLGPQFSSCFCQPDLLLLQYTCFYQFNTSCLYEPAALTNIPAYSFCDNAASVLASLPAATPALQTSSLLSHTSSAASSVANNASSITRPALPGSSSVAPGPQSTSSSSGDVTSGSMTHVGIAFGLMALWEAGFLMV